MEEKRGNAGVYALEGRGVVTVKGRGSWEMGRNRGSFNWGIKNNRSGEGWGNQGSCGTSSFVREGCVCARQRGLRGPRGVPLSPCQKLGVCKAEKKKPNHNWFSLGLFSVSLSFVLSHQ